MTHASLARPVAALALAAAAAAAPALAQGTFPTTPPPIGTPKAFKVPGRRTIVLANGMKVSLIPFGTVPKATVRLVIRTGSIDESADQVWLAALMTDYLSEGTTTRSARDVAEEAAGMGGGLAVGGGSDVVNLTADVLGENAAAMVRLEADVARHPKFAETELARLKSNRLRTLAIARSQSQAQANARFLELMYPDHPYGRLYPTEAQLQGYTVDQVRAFWAANVGAARAHLYVTGVFDAAAVERAAREAFGDWTAGAPPTVKPATQPVQRKVAVIDRPNAVQSTIYVGLAVPNDHSADYTKLLVTDAILGGTFGSRITSNIREKKGYTYSPGSFISQRKGIAHWNEVADVTTNVTGPALQEIFNEVDRLRTEAPPLEELDRIKRNMAGIFVLQNGSRGGVGGQYVTVDLQGHDDAWLRAYLDRVLAVTPADVQETMQKYLVPDRMTLVVVGDRKVIDEQLKPYTATVP
ncbi:MAG: insulinase family protein [Gemmatimonadetes bacterium]|nr:insulinase family protein [Gemmatimonadota bacterium]